jgi:hypothetical protein
LRLAPPPRWARALLIAGGFLVLALVETGLWRAPASLIWAGPDPSHDVFMLNWMSGHLFSGPGKMFDANIYYPARDSILFCNPLLAPALLASPVRAFTANPIFIFNAAQVLTLTVTSIGFYLLALRLFDDRGAALLAGAVIPFNAQVAAQLVHLDHMAIPGFPFAVLALLELFERPRVFPALVLAVAFALQAGTNGYHAWSILILCLVVAAWGWRAFRSPRTIAAVAGAAALALVLLAPYVLGFLRLRGDQKLGFRMEDNRAYSVELPGGLLQTKARVWESALGKLADGNRPVFPGAVVLVFAALALRRWREPRVRLLLLWAGVFFVLSLGPELILFGNAVAPLPYAFLFQHVPLFDSMRHPVTFAAAWLMALGLLAAAGLVSSGASRRPWLVALVLALAVAETLKSPPRRVAREMRLPEAYTWLLGQPRGAVLELPFEDQDAEWRSMFHGLPVLNGGCGSFDPEDYGALRRFVEREWNVPAPDGLEAFRSVGYFKGRFPARYVVVRPRGAAYRESLARTPRSFELVQETVAGDRVYRVRRGGRGPVLRRAFRDDQLRAGPVRAHLRGAEGTTVRVFLNDAPVEERPLRPEGEDVPLDLSRLPLVRGVNVIRLEQAEPFEAASVFELVDIEAAATP